MGGGSNSREMTKAASWFAPKAEADKCLLLIALMMGIYPHAQPLQKQVTLQKPQLMAMPEPSSNHEHEKGGGGGKQDHGGPTPTSRPLVVSRHVKPTTFALLSSHAGHSSKQIFQTSE